MSKKSNVHPDHYKVGGRGRPGEDIVQELQTQQYAQARRDATVHPPAAATKATTKGKKTRTVGKTQRNQVIADR